MTEPLDPIFEPIYSHLLRLRERLNRAEKHYKSFGDTWAEHIGSNPHQFDYVLDGDGTITVRLGQVSALPLELSLAFSELLHSLRASLDNCIYAVAALVSGVDPPPSSDRLEWPIRATAKEWKNQAKRYENLPIEIVEALEAIQPYHAECPEWNSLLILHDLARVDRHRGMHSLGLYLREISLVHDPEKIEVLHVRQHGIVADGDLIVRVRPRPGVELSSKNFSLDAEFDVDSLDVKKAPGPDGLFGRPWGGLDNRLRSLIKATREYTSGLLNIAADLVDSKPGT